MADDDNDLWDMPDFQAIRLPDLPSTPQSQEPARIFRSYAGAAADRIHIIDIDHARADLTSHDATWRAIRARNQASDIEGLGIETIGLVVAAIVKGDVSHEDLARVVDIPVDNRDAFVSDLLRRRAQEAAEMSTLTRKHFEAVAMRINLARRNASHYHLIEAAGALKALDSLANDLAIYFREENPEFDADRFRYRCVHGMIDAHPAPR